MKLNKNTNFFERILQIIDFYKIKNVNYFAKNYLGYSSSEKINRLKKEENKPSFDILVDISNKFEEINLNWLVTGKGNMLITPENHTEKSDIVEFCKEVIKEQKKEIAGLNQEIGSLKEKLIVYRLQPDEEMPAVHGATTPDIAQQEQQDAIIPDPSKLKESTKNNNISDNK